jgi:hypothetical protein
VAQASLLVLAALIDKSLLRRLPQSARYEIHELVRQYAAQKLAETPDDQAATLERHTAYFAAFLAARRDSLNGSDPRVPSRRLELFASHSYAPTSPSPASSGLTM